MRAPLIIAMPGTLPQGAVCKTPVGGVDLVPTFFRFAGLDLPWEMHGHDLTPLLKKSDSPWPHPVLMEGFGDHFGTALCLRTDSKESPPNATDDDHLAPFDMFGRARRRVEPDDRY